MTRRLLILAGLLISGAGAIHAASTIEAVPIRRPLDEMPVALASWRSAGDIVIDRSTRDVLRADDYLNRRYISGRTSADLFIAYYASQRQGDTMHSPMNCLPASGWQPLATGRIQIPVSGYAPIASNRYVIQKGLDQQLVLYWYQSHGRTIASEYASKVYLVLDSLRLRRSDAALVRVVVPIAADMTQVESAATDIIRAVFPILGDYIPS
jgi:EpsI family protein